MIYRINKTYVWKHASAFANAEVSQNLVHEIEMTRN